MQLQYRLLPLFDAMIGQPEFPEGFRRGALARGWDLGQSRQPLSIEQIETAKKTQAQLAQILSELSQWLPDIAPDTQPHRTTSQAMISSSKSCEKSCNNCDAKLNKVTGLNAG